MNIKIELQTEGRIMTKKTKRIQDMTFLRNVGKREMS